MKPYQGLELIPFQASDIEPLTEIMTRAFNYDAQIHRGVDDGPPGYNNGEFLRKWALHPQATAFKIELEGQAVGCVILWIGLNKADDNRLGCLFLDTNRQNQGLGVKIWHWVEATYPETKIWRTETPVFSKRNHHFYIDKCGFRILRIEKADDPVEGSVLLEKVMFV